MKLVYRDLPAGSAARPAVVLHDRGVASVDRVADIARESGAAGRLVAPFGDYGYTASGMELAGICWYRTIPGYAGTDPLTLAKAVVQVGDLLADLALADPVLVGWGQGAVVALGAGLLHPGLAGPVVCIDAQPTHVAALPERVFATAGPPPLLVMGAEGSVAGEESDTAGAIVEQLAGHGIEATGWRWSGGADEEPDKAVAEQIGRWLGDG